MAPDIASLPESPRLERSQPTSETTSRRTSQIMPPPQQPASASHLAPATVRSPTMSSNEYANVPMRHPRPLTAAELYLECEKEQEAVVNRLTRELTALRAQSASVASNASSMSSTSGANTSLLPVDISDPNPMHQMMGANHPTPSRRHRSSSSVSARSIPSASTSVNQGGGSHANAATTAHPVPLGGVSQASAERAAAATGERSSLSRNPSVSVSGRSTPARHSMDVQRAGGTLYTLPHRPSLSRDPSQTTISSTLAQPGTPGLQQVPSPVQSPHPTNNIQTAMQHVADTAAYRTEMEIVKAENDVLRQRVRALERALRQRRRDSSQSDVQRPTELNTSRENLPRLAETQAERSDRSPREFQRVPSFTSPPQSAGIVVWDGGIGGVAGPRERSESQSTTASSRRGVGVTEEEVRVGESATSVGLSRGA